MKRLSSLLVVSFSLLGGLNHSISRVNAQYYDCTVSCSAFAPETAEVGKAVQFSVAATPYYCNGQPTYLWTFGNGATSTQSSPSVTYQSLGAFSWGVTVTVDGQTASAGGIITITPRVVTSVSAASYDTSGLGSDSIAAAFGSNLATVTQVAGTLPLPTELAGTRVKVKDSAGTERLAPLFFVSPGQVNYQVPPGTATGMATVQIVTGTETVGQGPVPISATSPGIFTANSSGVGVPAAQLLRVKPDGTQIPDIVADFDSTLNRFVPHAIDLGPANDTVFLILFGTGIRFLSSLSAITVTIGGTSAQVQYAGPQGVYVGQDQVNLILPRSLAGRGEMDLVMTIGGKPANVVKVNVH